jgi:hypothetical protein
MADDITAKLQSISLDDDKSESENDEENQGLVLPKTSLF